MMPKLAIVVLVIAVAGLGFQLSVLAQNAEAASPLLVPYWVYRWAQSSDQSAEVWRSTPSADQWTQVGVIPGKVVDILATAADPYLALALTDRAVYRSRDAGETWARLNGLPDWPTTLAISQQASGLIYLGTLTGGVFRSTDEGDTWQALPPVVNLQTNTLPEITAMTIQPQDDQIIFVATGYWLGTTERKFTPQGVFMSLDGGDTWLMIYESELDEPRITLLVPDIHNPMAIQAGAEDGGRWYVFGDELPLGEWMPYSMAQQVNARVWRLSSRRV